MQRWRGLIGMAGCLSLSVWSAGCSSTEAAHDVAPASAEQTQAQIKRIQDNPIMPQPAKDAAIGALKNGSKQASAPATKP